MPRVCAPLLILVHWILCIKEINVGSKVIARHFCIADPPPLLGHYNYCRYLHCSTWTRVPQSYTKESFTLMMSSQNIQYKCTELEPVTGFYNSTNYHCTRSHVGWVTTAGTYVIIQLFGLVPVTCTCTVRYAQSIKPNWIRSCGHSRNSHEHLTLTFAVQYFVALLSPCTILCVLLWENRPLWRFIKQAVDWQQTDKQTDKLPYPSCAVTCTKTQCLVLQCKKPCS